jgi:DNA-binding transcriptional ArsR family regulator
MVSLLLDAMERSDRSKSLNTDIEVAHLPEDTGHGLASLFKLLSDETRLRIVYFLLQKEEINVRTFCRLLGQSQPAVSHHLAMLKEAGLLDSRRDGKHNFYRLMPQRMQQFVDLMFGGPPEQPRRFRLDDCVLTYSRDEKNG